METLSEIGTTAMCRCVGSCRVSCLHSLTQSCRALSSQFDFVCRSKCAKESVTVKVKVFVGGIFLCRILFGTIFVWRNFSSHHFLCVAQVQSIPIDKLRERERKKKKKTGTKKSTWNSQLLILNWLCSRDCSNSIHRVRNKKREVSGNRATKTKSYRKQFD